MTKNGGGQPTGDFADAIARKFGSLTAAQALFTESALGVFGSGWAFNSVCCVCCRLGATCCSEPPTGITTSYANVHRGPSSALSQEAIVLT
jgi:hypothetical protein